MKYKVGDKVRVVSKRPKESCMISEMLRDHGGKIVTIKSITEDNYYRIKEGTCSWDDACFEDTLNDSSAKFKPGDCVRVISNHEIYRNYQDFVKLIDLTRWTYGAHPEHKSTIFTVILSMKHLTNTDMIVAIQDEEGKLFLFGQDGLELVKVTKAVEKVPVVSRKDVSSQVFEDNHLYSVKLLNLKI
jgi:hypothetical protein